MTVESHEGKPIGVAIPEGYGTVKREDVDCERCEGGGEIILPYTLGTSADKGADNFAECPDCDGTGKVPAITITCHDGYVPRDGGSIAFLALRKKEE